MDLKVWKFMERKKLIEMSWKEIGLGSSKRERQFDNLDNSHWKRIVKKK